MVCTGEMGGVFSNSDGDSDMEAQVGFDPMGCTGSGADNPAKESPISGAVEVSCLANSVDHPNFTDIAVGCSTALVTRAEVLSHQSLLEQNRFSPISELASDSFEEEKLLLNWVKPTGSDTDEEDRHLMNYVPLAHWDPNGGLVLMTEEDDPVAISVEDELEPSAWVSKKIKGFGKWVGFPIDSCEKQCVEFFQRLEKVWEKQTAEGSLRRTTSSSTKGMRELRNLISTVNYDGQAGKRTREIVKFGGLGSDGCP